MLENAFLETPDWEERIFETLGVCNSHRPIAAALFVLSDFS